MKHPFTKDEKGLLIVASLLVVGYGILRIAWL